MDAAAETLQQAIRDLKPAETTDPDEPGAVDTTVLAATIAKGQAIDRAAYTAESLKALDEALSNAQQVLSDKDATQAQVDAAVQAIEDALAGLKPATGIEGQKPAGQPDLHRRRGYRRRRRGAAGAGRGRGSRRSPPHDRQVS